MFNPLKYPRGPINMKTVFRTSLVVQWLRICLPIQGTWVQSLVWDDPTCHVTTKPRRHNYWAWAPRVPALQAREATTMRSPCTSMKRNPCSPQLEKSPRSNKDPTQPKINNSSGKKKNQNSLYFPHCPLTKSAFPKHSTEYTLIFPVFLL